MIQIPLKRAQEVVLDCQLLTDNASLSGKNGVLKTIQHLGYVQIDTISVVARAHHHVLWTRVSDYQTSHLQTLGDAERAVFDYWAHAASYLPIETFPFSLIRKSTMDTGNGFWRRTDPKLAAHVLDRIKREGPLMAKDFEKENSGPQQQWMIPEINQVIRQLFMTGQLMAAGRNGIQKKYDLPSRVLPRSISRKTPSMRNYAEHIVQRDLRAHGLIKLSEIGYLLRIPKTDLLVVIDKMKRAGQVTEVEIRGLKDTYIASSNVLDEYSQSSKKKFHILSPFDNLIIQRKRTAELFGFDYTVECYVPAAKRKFGYFGLPLLYGHQFVGLLDAKADRKSSVFQIRKLQWFTKKKADLQRAFDNRLQLFANFCGCTKIAS